MNNIKTIKISYIQTALLAFLVITGGDVLFIPSSLAQLSYQDSWMGSIIGVIGGLLIIFLYTSLQLRFPDKNFDEICVLIFGKLIGKIVPFLFYFYFLILISLMVREFGEFMKVQMLPETPIIAIHILFFSVIIVGVLVGLETLARAAEITFPLIFLLFFVLVIFSLPNVKPQNFLPMFEYGFTPLVQSGMHYQYFTNLQVVVFLFLLPTLKKEEKKVSPLFIGSIIGGAMLITLSTLSIGVLGVESLLLQYYPSYVLAMEIYIGDFITRIEVLIAGMWFLTIYFKTTLYFYTLSIGLAQSFKITDYRLFVMPLGIITLIYSITIYPNPVFFQSVLVYWNSLIVTMGLIIPLFMMGIAMIKKLNTAKNTGTSSKNP